MRPKNSFTNQSELMIQPFTNQWTNHERSSFPNSQVGSRLPWWPFTRLWRSSTQRNWPSKLPHQTEKCWCLMGSIFHWRHQNATRGYHLPYERHYFPMVLIVPFCNETINHWYFPRWLFIWDFSCDNWGVSRLWINYEHYLFGKPVLTIIYHYNRCCISYY